MITSAGGGRDVRRRACRSTSPAPPTTSRTAPLPASAFTWRVDYITGGVERQARARHRRRTAGSFTPAVETPFLGTDVLYRVVLTVRDSIGLEATTSVDLAPQVGTINLATEPAGHGLKLTLDGRPPAAHGGAQGVVGVQRVLVAPPTQVVNGVTYNFVQLVRRRHRRRPAVVTGAARRRRSPRMYTPVERRHRQRRRRRPRRPSVVVPPAASLLTGGKARMTVRVTNPGGARWRAPMAFAIVASPDAFLDPEDPVVATVTPAGEARAGQVAQREAQLQRRADVPAGSYLLLVRPDAGGVGRGDVGVQQRLGDRRRR